jgi:hypothetical protein
MMRVSRAVAAVLMMGVFGVPAVTTCRGDTASAYLDDLLH